MKKIIVIVLSLIIGILLYKKDELVIIPNESIRVRIIANSNNIKDLVEKKHLKDKLEEKVLNLVKDTKTIEEAREIINNNMNTINDLIQNNINVDYNINYGINYFPKKIYKGVLYEAGNYESLVITLGEGIGENWWCVLFPPLCLIDENTTTSDIEYQLFVKELLEK